VEAMLDQNALAKYLRVSTRTLRTWVQQGLMLKPIRIGRRSYWPESKVQRWLEERAEAPAEAPPPLLRPALRRRGRPRLPA
jgi:excisionase family DNA binding protein